MEYLTNRELEVLKLIAKGLSNKRIAWELNISVPTTKVHVRNIFIKLKVGNRTKATLVFLSQQTGESCGL